MHHRAYSLISVKGFDPIKRTFGGIATSPVPDRVGDIIDPAGVVFKNPMPLMLYHDSKKPVGEARFRRATADGIPFDALISTIDRDSGVVKERLDEAVDSLRADPPLIRGVSIGFRPLEDPIYIKETGGFRYPKVEVLELSMVVIPAHQDATIQTLKSLDIGLAAIGTEADIDRSRQSAGASASSRVVHVMTTRTGTKMPKPIAEQIKSFEATRAAKVSERDAIMEKAADAGVTLDPQQKEQYDTLDGEIIEIDEHLGRLGRLERSNAAAAKAVDGSTKDKAADSRDPQRQVISLKDPTPPDLMFARMVLCKAASFYESSRGNFISALEIAKKRYPSNELIHNYLLHKSAVAGGTTTDSNFASALLAPSQVLESAFLEYLRPKTILGKFGTNGIPSLRSVPFNVKVQSQTSGATAGWVGEGKAKPVTKFNTTSTTLLFTKVAAIAVITDELARFSVPGAEGLVRDELTRCVVERIDTDFVDPANAGTANVKPASITNGLTGLTTNGTTAANVLSDLQLLLNAFANYNVSDLVLIMPNSLALVLSLMENSLGQPAFSGVTINGGNLRGIPVITSQYVASGASYGNMVIAVHASSIALADDGTVSVDASREASIQMDDAPSQDSTAGTGSTSVSMWQTNSIALRAEREINWKKLRSDAVVFMDDVNWGAIGSPY